MKLELTTDSGVSVAVAFDRWDGDRAQWRWTFTDDETVLASGDDLRSGASSIADAADALRSLASFLATWAESDGGDNADLFPESLRGLADWEEVALDVSEWMGGVR